MDGRAQLSDDKPGRRFTCVTHLTFILSLPSLRNIARIHLHAPSRGDFNAKPGRTVNREQRADFPLPLPAIFIAFSQDEMLVELFRYFREKLFTVINTGTVDSLI